MLEIKGLSIRYGSVEVVSGVTMHVDEGKIVALIGPNGAGKSSVLRAISGLVRPASGEIVFRGINLVGIPPHEIAAVGIAHVMEGRHLFGGLTVEDNLLLAGHSKAGSSAGSLESILQRWPILAQRRKQLAGSLSGGEQQLLAIGRALMSRPHLLMLDEPSWGLAPLLVRELMNAFVQMRAQGMTILLVEQMAKMALKICDYGYVMSSGSIVMEGSAQDLLANPDLQASYLGGKASLERPKEMATRPAPATLAEARQIPPIQVTAEDWQRRERERQEKEKRMRDSAASLFSFRAPVQEPRYPPSETWAEKERLRQIQQQTFRSDQKIAALQEDMGQMRKEISTARKTSPVPEVRTPSILPTQTADWRSLELHRQQRQAAWKTTGVFQPGAEGRQDVQLNWKARESARRETQASFERETQVSGGFEPANWAARERERQKREEEWRSKMSAGQSQIPSVPSGPRVVRDWQELERIRMEKERDLRFRGVPQPTPPKGGQGPADWKERELAREQRQAAWQKKAKGP